jgi:hypothetical protein
MDGAWLVRMRWRRRGAWLWPAFVALTAADAVIGHSLPPAGESQNVIAAALAGLVLNLIAVILLRRPVALILRRMRPDLPMVVARDYAGVAAVLVVSAGLLAAGLSHRSWVLADQRTMADATARAEAWIGDHAPAEFRRNVRLLSTVVIQAGSIYRSCAMNDDHTRTYCVIVKDNLPFANSVTFDGYEPNYLFVIGTQ